MLISALFTAALANPDAGVCADYSGQAFGQCNAYCEAMDCDDNPNANQQACDNAYNSFVALTGEAPPCEITEYDVSTTYSGDDSIEVYIDGVQVAWQNGDQWWSFDNTHAETLVSGDHTVAYRVWDVGGGPVGLGAFISIDGAIVARTDDNASFVVTGSNPGAGWDDVAFNDTGWTVAQTCTWDPWWSTNLANLDAEGIVWAWTSSSCSIWSDPSEAWFRVNLTLP